MKIKYIDRATGKLAYETPPAEGLLKFLYDNPLGKTAILPLAKRKLITTLYGRRMNSPSSVKKIKGFVEQLNIDMTEAEKPMEAFTSFNDFFYRKLKAGARSIGNGFVSPGDGKLLAFENFSEVNQFYVKGRKFTLTEFLANEALAKQYANASMIILRLAPNDYHRYHFPFDGTPSASQLIEGYYYSVSPYALLNNFTQVFCENKREICHLQLPETPQEVLIVPVGATMVGSIISTYRPNAAIKKGDEMGYFAFGGSTIVLLFDAALFKIDADLLTNTANGLETFVKMGEQLATKRP